MLCSTCQLSKANPRFVEVLFTLIVNINEGYPEDSQIEIQTR